MPTIQIQHKENNTPPNVTDLLERPIWQMTGAEFVSLMQSAMAAAPDKDRKKDPGEGGRAYGLRELADRMGCGLTTVNKFRHLGVLDDAILSRLGTRIVFDVDKAVAAANRYQKIVLKKNV